MKQCPRCERYTTVSFYRALHEANHLGQMQPITCRCGQSLLTAAQFAHAKPAAETRGERMHRAAMAMETHLRRARGNPYKAILLSINLASALFLSVYVGYMRASSIFLPGILDGILTLLLCLLARKLGALLASSTIAPQTYWHHPTLQRMNWTLLAFAWVKRVIGFSILLAIPTIALSKLFTLF